MKVLSSRRRKEEERDEIEAAATTAAEGRRGNGDDAPRFCSPLYFPLSQISGDDYCRDILSFCFSLFLSPPQQSLRPLSSSYSGLALRSTQNSLAFRPNRLFRFAPPLYFFFSLPPCISLVLFLSSHFLLHLSPSPPSPSLPWEEQSPPATEADAQEERT